MRLTLKAVNPELAKRGHNTILVNGDGYFYFRGDEAADWLDKTVRGCCIMLRSSNSTLSKVANGSREFPEETNQ